MFYFNFSYAKFTNRTYNSLKKTNLDTKNLNCKKLKLVYNFIDISKYTIHNKESINNMIINKKKKIKYYYIINNEIILIQRIIKGILNDYNQYKNDKVFITYLIKKYRFFNSRLDKLKLSKYNIIDDLNDLEYDENMLMRIYDIKKSYIDNIISNTFNKIFSIKNI